MGLVLSFVPRVAASHPRHETAGQPAAIIIFPGVRYERRAEPIERRGRIDSESAMAIMSPKPKPKH